MKVLVLGGTGRTGSLVVDDVRSAGHEVTALVRDASRVLDASGVRVLTGDAHRRADIDRTLDGQDAVISTLGSRSVLRSDIAAPAASNFVPLAESRKVSRVIVMSAFGVGTTYDQSSPIVRVAFSTVLRSLYRDKTTADDIVRRSSLDWTIVHPVTLTDDGRSARLIATERLTDRRNMKVSRADVADFLVSALTSAEWSHKTVILASLPAPARLSRLRAASDRTMF